MSKKERKLRTVMLRVPGGVVPHIGRFTDDELDEFETRGSPAALFQRAAAGELSGGVIARNRAVLLLEAVKADRPDMLARLVPEKKRLAVETFFALTEAAAGRPDAAAWLLQYRRAHYLEQDLEAYETHRLDLELGFSEPSVAELRKELRLHYTAGGVKVSGAKEAKPEYSIPARIGEKDVVGVDAAAFYAMEPMPRMTRAFAAPATPDLRGVKPGDTVHLGRAAARRNEAERPIAWRVLARKEGRLLVLCEKAVAILPYHPELEEVTWETCAIRRWLNTVFLPLAFSEPERARILPTDLTTPDNPIYGTPGGAGTTDRLFLLSGDEVSRLLPTEAARQLGQRWWWLRSPGFDNTFAGTVTKDGSLGKLGSFVDSDDYAVRPAMWLRADDAED